MQNLETFQTKRIIFDLFEYSRELFNNYYNGFENNYDADNINKIKQIIEEIEKDTKEIKEWI